MKVLPFQVRKADNWMYLIVDEASNEAAVVDVWDADQMVDKAKDHGVKVS
jgi:hydroxyacylglutathione hydrolase